MKLTAGQQEIIDGKAGKILQSAMEYLFKYGSVMGADEFIPITSAHTAFKSLDSVAQTFSSTGALLNREEIISFGEALSRLKVKVRTTTNITYADTDKWRQMGASEETYSSVKAGIAVAQKCGIIPTCSCTPYLMYNIPQMGEHCSWCESSAFLYANAILGARSNRDGEEVSLSSALLGITPKFGMHVKENRKGTHLIHVKCKLSDLCDWGALGYYAGEISGIGIPVFSNLRRPTIEEAKQLCAALNTSGATAMFHIAGVTPEALNIEEVFGNKRLKNEYIFDISSKMKMYECLNRDPDGTVDMVCVGCPFCTIQEVIQVAKLIDGNKIATGTRLWILMDYPTRFMAERYGYAEIIERSGGELIAGGCPQAFNTDACKVGRMATNSAKQAYYAAGVLGNKIFFGNLERCIEIAIKGGT